MASSVTISPVPRRRRGEALRFLSGGRSEGLAAELQAETLGQLASARGWRSVRLWWARRDGRCVATAMVLPNPGRTGFLLHSPLEADGVNADALAELVRSISTAAVAGGLCLLQRLVTPGDRDEAGLLMSCGYAQLAELVYMRLDVADLADGALVDSGPWGWKTCGEFSEQQLCGLIEATYRGSLDCPALAGVRDVADVVAGHKATGEFRPESWWIAELDGEAAGCILVNRSSHPEAWEVVYLGVRPEYRGRGLARAMVRLAAGAAARHGVARLALAVDDRNVYASRVYLAEGFRETRRRVAYVFMAR